jgi:hypothetical protein
VGGVVFTSSPRPIPSFRRLFAFSLGRKASSGGLFPVSPPRGCWVETRRRWVNDETGAPLGWDCGSQGGDSAAGGLNDQVLRQTHCSLADPDADSFQGGQGLTSSLSCVDLRRTRRRRRAEDCPPCQRWACERPARGRALGPPSAAERLHARFSEISFAKCGGAFADRGTHSRHCSRTVVCHNLTKHWPLRVLVKAALRTLTNMYRRIPLG